MARCPRRSRTHLRLARYPRPTRRQPATAREQASRWRSRRPTPMRRTARPSRVTARHSSDGRSGARRAAPPGPRRHRLQSPCRWAGRTMRSAQYGAPVRVLDRIESLAMNGPNVCSGVPWRGAASAVRRLPGPSRRIGGRRLRGSCDESTPARRAQVLDRSITPSLRRQRRGKRPRSLSALWRARGLAAGSDAVPSFPRPTRRCWAMPSVPSACSSRPVSCLPGDGSDRSAGLGRGRKRRGEGKARGPAESTGAHL